MKFLLAIITFLIFVAIYTWIITLALSLPLMWIMGVDSGGWAYGLIIGFVIGIILAFKKVRKMYF